MSLFVDRIFHDESVFPSPDTLSMNNHLLVAMLMSWAMQSRFPGDFPGIDRSVVIAALGLTAEEEEATLDELIADYNSQTDAKKDRYFERLTNLTIAAEQGPGVVISKSYFHTQLGLTE